MDFLSNFSETLSELMLINKLSAKELGKRISIDRSTITKYKAKRSYPELKFAIKIADYFGCSLDYMFGLSNDYERKEYASCPPFFEVFQELLKSRNCTQYKLYTVLDFNEQSVSDWFHGKRIPAVDNIIRISNYFGCTLDELVGRKAVD